jgi:type VI secretion system protein ImpC
MPPFQICILGDFSGRDSRGQFEPESVARRPVIAVDRDNFDDLPARLGVELSLGVARGAPVTLSIGDLDHFRPESLVETVDLFAELRALRRRLQDPARFAAAAAEMADWAAAKPDKPAAEPAPPATDVPTDDNASAEDLLSASIAATEERAVVPVSSGPRGLADRLVAQVIAPYVEPTPDPRQADYVAAVDEAMAGLLRRILHAPAFQAAEAAWRSLYLLVRRLETGPDLKLFLVDVTRAELAADLAAAEDPRQSGLYRLLVEPSVDAPGGVPWSLWVGDFAAGPSLEDIGFLGQLGRLAGRAGAPLVARGEPGLVGAADFGATPDPDDWREPWEVTALGEWEALRRQPEAAYLALALPRWLARLPYGRDSDPVDGFAFEEIDGAGAHDQFLWANPAFMVGLALADAFKRQGWRMGAERPAEIDSLPFYVYKADGESHAKPCAELLLTERGGETLVDRGLTPIWWVKNLDRIRVGPVRSLSEDLPRLAGRWTG